MTAEKLTQCLENNANELRGIVSSLNLIPSPLSLHNDCITEIREFELMANQLDATRNLIEPREHARNILKQLPSVTNSNTNLIDYHGKGIPFSNARILWFQGYLSMTWAICDSITTAISPLFFSKSTYSNSSRQLLAHFVKEDKHSAYYSHLFLNRNYGWPIGVSYVIRNHFFHDGALCDGRDFFAGTSVTDEFDISQEGWDFLEDEMRRKHNLREQQTRCRVSWPWHRNNLLNLLELCNNEIDEALIYLVSCSVKMTKSQMEYLLQRDIHS